jgi:hypothetical protein
MFRQIGLLAVIVALLSFNTHMVYAQSGETRTGNSKEMSVEESKRASVGEWRSITTEVRPSAQKAADGSIKPFYLTRQFRCDLTGDFDLVVTTYGDPSGRVAVSRMDIKGHMIWQGAHPVAPGAQKVDFIADVAYSVTPLAQGFADVLNQYTKGFEKWEVNKAQSIFKRAFLPFGLKEGDVFKEYDLVYIYQDMMFWGARHVDGRGFDSEENRPTNLQIPMVRK